MNVTKDILDLEKLCEQMYNARLPEQIHDGNKWLESFTQSQDCLSKCKIVLDRGVSPYSQLISCNIITKAVTRNTIGFSVDVKLELRNYILNYLYTRQNLANFVINGLVQLFAKITKHSWFDQTKADYAFRNLTQDISKFLQGTTQQCSIGIKLFSELVQEMNHMDEAEMDRSISKHRKISTSFRDISLLEIFTIACNLLKQVNTNIQDLNTNDQVQHDLIAHLLQLSLNCLLYDFLGTLNEDTSDDMTTVQIPNTWRSLIMDFTNIDIYFNLYHNLRSSELASKAIACLVQISALRRSFFNNNERMKFLNELIVGVKQILQSPSGLQDQKCYHEFCRLLCRLKCNYQLSELVKIDGYSEIIDLIAKFTITSLRVPQFSPNSLYYLLSLWQRMVASVPYIKTQEPHNLETYTPEITKTYITSRLELVNLVVRDGLDDPFEDLASVYQQLEQISIIGRCEYEKTCAILVQLFDETAAQYQTFIEQSSNSFDLRIKEGQLTWLVYIIGGVIGGRQAYSCATNTEDHDLYDGELVVRVIQLMNFLSTRQDREGNACEKLDLAMLNFFEQFRKIFIGDQVQKVSKVYKRMSEVLGITDENVWLNVMMRKIITNLKYWTLSEKIINKTLNLLNDLSVGYSSVRKLMKLDSIHFILANHTSEHFPFLGFQTPLKDMRCRTVLYTALGRLLSLDLTDDDENFDRFMLPLSNQLDSIANSVSSNLNDTKLPIVGLARDLRGLAFAFNSRLSYMQLFDWIYPRYLNIFTKAVELWYNEPLVTTPILKLMCELVQNRSQRLVFDVSSPNGILLFREASKMVCAYGNRINQIQVSKDQEYALKLKGVSICFNILKWSLSGGYVNFGVFRLYNDSTLQNSLDVFIKLVSYFQQSDLVVYSKLSVTYYGLLEVLTSDHMSFIDSLEPQVFLYILQTISDGLTAFDSITSTSCCSALDHIITYLYRQLTRKKKQLGSNTNSEQENKTLVQVYQQHQQVFQQNLSTVLNIVVFEDCRNQWSMSRPLLGLILLNEQYFDQWRQNLITSQAQDRIDTVTKCVENLMNGIEPNLTTKNRDKFTQNISTFRREINESIKSNASSTSNGSTQNIIDMMN